MSRAAAARPLRVWIVNHYAQAPDRPTGTRHYDLARQLAARGQDVVIFAAGFSNVTHREERLSGRRLYRFERFGGVRFVWLRTFPYAGSTWRRQVNMLTFFLAFLLVQLRFPAPDAVIGSTVHPFAALAAWIAAAGRGARFLFEIRDLWPQTLVDLGALRVGSLGERLLRGIEAHLVRRAAVVITLLPGIRDYLHERGLPVDRVLYLPNGIDLASFDRPPGAKAAVPAAVTRSLDAIARLRAEGRLVVGYVGSFGRVNRLDVVTRAAAIAEARTPGRVGVVLIGDGTDRAQLERLAGTAVAVCAPIPKDAVPAVLQALDATVIHATATPVYRYGISFNKLFDSLAAARPVVFACWSAYDPVAAVGAGITVGPDDPEALAAALLELAGTTPDWRSVAGNAGRAYVAREHDVERLGAALADAVMQPDDPRRRGTPARQQRLARAAAQGRSEGAT